MPATIVYPAAYRGYVIASRNVELLLSLRYNSGSERKQLSELFRTFYRAWSELRAWLLVSTFVMECISSMAPINDSSGIHRLPLDPDTSNMCPAPYERVYHNDKSKYVLQSQCAMFRRLKCSYKRERKRAMPTLTGIRYSTPNGWGGLCYERNVVLPSPTDGEKQYIHKQTNGRNCQYRSFFVPRGE